MLRDASAKGPFDPQKVAGTRVSCLAFESNRDLARYVGEVVARLIRERNSQGQKAVLGLPTGSTPLGVYRELIRLHRDEGLDFSGVVTFNLDEYFGLGSDQLQSYRRWMQSNFFQYVNIPADQIHIPDGTVPLESAEDHCRQYEEQIRAAGGIDLQLLGIGRNGHIGFNEPFSLRHSRTRLATLDPVTRKDAASDFFGEDNVPVQAFTMGIGTILQARKILLLALGEHKASIIREMVEGPTTERVPASLLAEHSDATVLVDRAAASKLTAIETPWLATQPTWSDEMIKRAVLWLSLQTKRALLRLEDEDFRAHNLHQLLRRHGPAERIAHRVFRMMMETIEYHPAGKEPKRVICFSPHPDDDVISMGGTLIRLIEDGHQVHVAYMTSGNIAVWDHDAVQLVNLVTEYNRRFGIDNEKSQQLEQEIRRFLADKSSGQTDMQAVLDIKGMIRWSEAKAGALVCGCREDQLHFLDLPFYRTGTIDKKPFGPEDVKIVRDLIEKVRPDQIYLAGDLSDPHGTHRVCAETIFTVLMEVENETGHRPEALLYRGAWQEYAPHEIEIAVPLNPLDLLRKRNAIFRHESQKDKAPFPGSDDREFWQRAEERNRHTADLYNQLGLPEYLALEGFVRWNGQPL